MCVVVFQTMNMHIDRHKWKLKCERQKSIQLKTIENGARKWSASNYKNATVFFSLRLRRQNKTNGNIFALKKKKSNHCSNGRFVFLNFFYYFLMLMVIGTDNKAYLSNELVWNWSQCNWHWWVLQDNTVTWLLRLTFQ